MLAEDNFVITGKFAPLQKQKESILRKPAGWLNINNADFDVLFSFLSNKVQGMMFAEYYQRKVHKIQNEAEEAKMAIPFFKYLQFVIR